MKIDWSDQAIPIAFFPMLDLSGPVPILGFRRIFKKSWLDVIAEVDGSVRNAVFLENPTGTANPSCYDIHDDLRDGHYVFNVGGADQTGIATEYNKRRGGFGAPIAAALPKLLGESFPDGRGLDYFVSKNYVARIDSLTWRIVVMPWSLSPETVVTSPATDPDGLPAHQVVWQGDALFWKTSNSYQSGINVWTATEGTRPFIRWVKSETQGAGNFGTDGIDMVWAYGEKTASSDTWTKNSIMTAPFTTDPATANSKARRLRSFPIDCIGCQSFAVRCGHAATRTVGNGTLVVRIKDGWSWVIPPKVAGKGFHYAFGITCDEVFIAGEIDGKVNIHRIRLDSLGPGVAAD